MRERSSNVVTRVVDARASPRPSIIDVNCVAESTCRDSRGAILTSQAGQDESYEECTYRAPPRAVFDIRPSAYRVVSQPSDVLTFQLLAA